MEMYSIKGPISLFVQHIVSMYIHAQSCCIENRAIGLGLMRRRVTDGRFQNHGLVARYSVGIDPINLAYRGDVNAS